MDAPLLDTVIPKLLSPRPKPTPPDTRPPELTCAPKEAPAAERDAPKEAEARPSLVEAETPNFKDAAEFKPMDAVTPTASLPTVKPTPPKPAILGPTVAEKPTEPLLEKIWPTLNTPLLNPSSTPQVCIEAYW